MKRKFVITGLRPLLSPAASQLMRAFDLGIDNGYMEFAEILTITISDDCTQEKLDKQPGAIVWAYEQKGCKDIVIRELMTMRKPAALKGDNA